MEEMLSDQECDKLASECIRAVNKVARLVNDKYGGIRDINDNLKGRKDTEEKVNYLKSLLEEFPNIQEIRDPYQMLFNERNAAIIIRDATYRKLNDCPATLEESNVLKNENKKELKKRLSEIMPIAKKREELVSYLEGRGQEKAGVSVAMKFLSQLEDLYNTEIKAMSKDKVESRTSLFETFRKNAGIRREKESIFKDHIRKLSNEYLIPDSNKYSVRADNEEKAMIDILALFHLWKEKDIYPQNENMSFVSIKNAFNFILTGEHNPQPLDSGKLKERNREDRNYIDKIKERKIEFEKILYPESLNHHEKKPSQHLLIKPKNSD